MKAREKSRLGQNFLVDERAQRMVVDALGPAGRGAVLEIGPGKAAITTLLAARASRLVAVEVDPALAATLRTHFAASPTVEILETDVLALDIASLVHEPRQGQERGRTLAVIGNLPYYITSPILQHLFTHERVLSRAVLMVQREVAERMTAEPGHSEYGALSVLCQIHATVQLLFTLPPGAFQPQPEVHSAAVRLEFAPRWQELGVEPGPFTRFLRMCFAQKRKTLSNNLRAAGYEAGLIGKALQARDTTTNARAEELSPAELAAVFLGLQPAPPP